MFSKLERKIAFRYLGAKKRGFGSVISWVSLIGIMLNAGDYEVFVGSCQPDARSIALTGKKPASFAVTCKKTEKI